MSFFKVLFHQIKVLFNKPIIFSALNYFNNLSLLMRFVRVSKQPSLNIQIPLYQSSYEQQFQIRCNNSCFELNHGQCILSFLSKQSHFLLILKISFTDNRFWKIELSLSMAIKISSLILVGLSIKTT